MLRLETLTTEQDYRIRMRRRHEENVHDGGAHDEEKLPAGGERVVAATVAAPTGVALRLSDGGLRPLFAVDFRQEDRPAVPVLEIAQDGTCRVRDELSATEVAPAVLVLTEPAATLAASRPWRWYQVSPAEGGAQTRIELEPPLLPGALDRSRLVVGAVDQHDRLAPLLMVDAGGTTVVRGRLEVRGPVVHNPIDGTSADAGPALTMHGWIRPSALANVWISNVGSQAIDELAVVMLLPESEPWLIAVPSRLPSGDQVHRQVALPDGVDAVTVTAVGLLPDGRLCHARYALQELG